MSAKHTAGPWRAVKAPHGPIDIFDPRNRDVVTVYGGGVGSEDKEANARLIAAAPDMLEALKMASGRLSHPLDDHDHSVAAQIYRAVFAAIAKATAA